MRIEIVDSFAGLWGGKGGFWEDRGYEWYAGIRAIPAKCVAVLRPGRVKKQR